MERHNVAKLLGLYLDLLSLHGLCQHGRRRFGLQANTAAVHAADADDRHRDGHSQRYRNTVRAAEFDELLQLILWHLLLRPALFLLFSLLRSHFSFRFC